MQMCFLWASVSPRLGGLSPSSPHSAQSSTEMWLPFMTFQLQRDTVLEAASVLCTCAWWGSQVTRLTGCPVSLKETMCCVAQFHVILVLFIVLLVRMPGSVIRY